VTNKTIVTDSLIIIAAIAIFLSGSFFIWNHHSNLAKKEERPLENMSDEKTEGIVLIEEKKEVAIEAPPPPLPTPLLFEYIQIVDSCGPHYEGVCVNGRSGPGLEFPAMRHLREGVILKVDGKVEKDGYTWYKVAFDEWLRYPERVVSDLYVASDYTKVILENGTAELEEAPKDNGKMIVVDRSEQKLYAYENNNLFMSASVSTGLELTPTPRGTFTIFRKTPSRYMQGPIPNISEKYWDLLGVPWNLYFTKEGAVIHGTYWHDNFGSQSSNGCVNMRPEEIKELYAWADLGTTVVVRD